MNAIELNTERFERLQSEKGRSQLAQVGQQGFHSFSRLGIPTVRNEEWKYTRIGPLFQKEYGNPSVAAPVAPGAWEAYRLPGHETANELVFVNGRYQPALSTIRSAGLQVMPLEVAAENEHRDIVARHLGHSSRYNRDGLHALNTAFVQEGVFIHIAPKQRIDQPICIYHITDARSASIFSQPRILAYVAQAAQAAFVASYATLGDSESFTNEVFECVVDRDAVVEYYKIQQDTVQASQVGTTHFRQIGKSTVHTVTLSLNGGTVRNNLSMALEAEYCETHLYGLYFLKGESHTDNHTVVDHVQPNCQSNELYKGIIGGTASAVFNGKIAVQPQAQKTNAFQSNKNVLMSDQASVNTKPQLEIFADDVKCSHGCTVGQLDEEALFYLQSRGIGTDRARAMLVHAFAMDVLEHIKPEALRHYVDGLITERLEMMS